MTVMAFVNDETETNTTLQAWQTKLTATKNMTEERDHIIWVSAEYTGGLASLGCEVQVLIDGVVRGNDQYVPPAGDAWHAFSSMGLLSLAVGDHTVTLQFRGAVGQTTKIRRARILVMRH